MSDLNVLIPQYGINKSELDSYKKICDEENKQIKAIMANMPDDTYEVDGWKAKYTIQRRESMNEDVLLSILCNTELIDDSTMAMIAKLGIIKTRTYIDFDALESAIYNHKIPNELLIEMDKAREIKEVETLKVTRIKEKNK